MPRKLPPIEHRKRVSRKDCTTFGDYRKDVDEGILEEVRIFNEELNIPTRASCEGHLPDASAYILGSISDEIQDLFRKHMIEIRKPQIQKGKWRTEFIFEESDYTITISIDGDFARGYDDGFSVHVKSIHNDLSQNDWDNIRKKGFFQAINIIKKSIQLP